jgi:hypothetical protein
MKSIYLKEKNNVIFLGLVMKKIKKKLEVKALNGH